MKKSSLVPLKHAALVFALLGAAPFAQATLLPTYQFNGKGNWSIDGLGTAAGGNLQAFVPVGSTVQAAFLYTTLIPGFSTFTSITFDGTELLSGGFTNQGTNPYGATSFRTDVTSIVAAKVGGGSALAFDFSVTENSSDDIDGEVLAIVYSNPNESERTIAFLGGFTDAAGDSFAVNLGAPLIDPTTPGFEALFTLGIGYSYQSGGSDQASNIRIDGRYLTSSAGGEDDGYSNNGGLVTVGGLGDSPLNPADPLAHTTGPRFDDELYNLALGNGVNSAPFLTTGSTSFTVLTQNPSGDDNIFFAGLNITARAGVNQPPPPPVDQPLGAVPEPSTYGLIGAAALIGLAMRRRFKK